MGRWHRCFRSHFSGCDADCIEGCSRMRQGPPICAPISQSSLEIFLARNFLRQGRGTGRPPPARLVRRGTQLLPPDQRGLTILGTPLGHLDFVKAQLRAKAEEHRILILSFCCVTKANCYLRTIQPEGSEEFAAVHDTAISRVFNSLLDIRGDQSTFNLASLPCKLGGVGLRNAVRGAQAVYWSSWADSLHGRGGGGPHTEAAAQRRESLVIGFRCSGVGRSGKGASSRFRSSSRPVPQFEQRRMATESFRRCGE